MPFNVQAALDDGITEEQIAQYLAKQHGFNLDAALADRVPLKTIIDHLATYEPPEPPQTRMQKAKAFVTETVPGLVKTTPTRMPGITEDREEEAAESAGIMPTGLARAAQAQPPAQEVSREVRPAYQPTLEEVEPYLGEGIPPVAAPEIPAPTGGVMETIRDIHGAVSRPTQVFNKALVDEALGSLPNFITKRMTGKDFVEKPEGTGEEILSGAGRLAGFLLGAPGAVYGAVSKKIIEKFPSIGLNLTEGIARKVIPRTASQIAIEAPGLAAASGVAGIGRALDTPDIETGIRTFAKEVAGGAAMGTIFGGTKALIPGSGAMDRIKRIAVGMALLDTLRGQHPFDDREVGQKVFDYGMDAFFLWHGMSTKALKAYEKDINRALENEGLTNDEIREAWKNPANREALLRKYAGVRYQEERPPEAAREAQAAPEAVAPEPPPPEPEPVRPAAAAEPARPVEEPVRPQPGPAAAGPVNPPLPQDFFNQMRDNLVKGEDESGKPFTIDHAKAFRDYYASSPKANPASLQAIDQFIADATAKQESLTELHNLRRELANGLDVQQGLAWGNDLKVKYPHLSDDINKTIIEFQGKPLERPVPQATPPTDTGIPPAPEPATDEEALKTWTGAARTLEQAAEKIRGAAPAPEPEGEAPPKEKPNSLVKDDRIPPGIEIKVKEDQLGNIWYQISGEHVHGSADDREEAIQKAIKMEKKAPAPASEKLENVKRAREFLARIKSPEKKKIAQAYFDWATEGMAKGELMDESFGSPMYQAWVQAVEIMHFFPEAKEELNKQRQEKKEKWEAELKAKAAAEQKPAPKHEEIQFRSGAGAPEIQGYTDAGKDFGTIIDNLDDENSLKNVLDHVRSGGNVFIDSGAVQAYRQNYDLDFDRIVERYKEIAKEAGEDAKGLYFVTPDKIADATYTLGLMERYADDMKALKKMGANLIVPIQDIKNPVSAWNYVHVFYGTDNQTIPGITAKENPMPPDTLGEFVKAVRPQRVHLLGISPERKKQFNLLKKAVEDNSPLTQISSDSNRAAAMLGKGRKLTEKEQQIKYDLGHEIDTDLIEDLSPTERAIVGKEMGWKKSDIKKWQNGENPWEIFPKEDLESDQFWMAIKEIGQRRSHAEGRAQAIAEIEHEPKDYELGRVKGTVLRWQPDTGKLLDIDTKRDLWMQLSSQLETRIKGMSRKAEKFPKETDDQGRTWAERRDILLDKRNRILEALGDLGGGIEVRRVETPKKAVEKRDLSEILKVYQDEDATVADVAAMLKDADINQDLKDALDDYEDAVKADRKKYGMRSGLGEDAGEELIVELERQVEELAGKADLEKKGKEAGVDFTERDKWTRERLDPEEFGDTEDWSFRWEYDDKKASENDNIYSYKVEDYYRTERDLNKFDVTPVPETYKGIIYSIGRAKPSEAKQDILAFPTLQQAQEYVENRLQNKGRIKYPGWEAVLKSSEFRKIPEESPYADDNFDTLMLAAEKEQRERWAAIREMEKNLAAGAVKPHKVQEVKDRLKALKEVYEGTYSEIESAGGDVEVIRESIEGRKEKPVDHTLPPYDKSKIRKDEDMAKSLPAGSVFPKPKETVKADSIAKQKGEILTKAQADARLTQWKAEADRVRNEEDHSNQVIISLFDRTGVWSEPYERAGYNVLTYDRAATKDEDIFSDNPLVLIQDIEARGWEIVGILSAPPCTSFAVSGARWWANQHDIENPAKVEDLYGIYAAKLFDTPLDAAEAIGGIAQIFVEYAKRRGHPVKFHVLENPVGRIAERTGLPKPLLTFNPNNYGDPYTKKTQLWGDFNPDLPQANVEPYEGSKVHKLRGDVPEQKLARSETPEGFAYSFFMANHDIPSKKLTPAAEATRRQIAETKDAPLNPKVEPLVNELNNRNIPTFLSGDLYGDKVVYVDLPGGTYVRGKLEQGSDKYEKLLENVDLPEGWAVIRADVTGSDAFITGKPEDTAPRPRETKTRLIRKGGAVTEEEARAVADAVQEAIEGKAKPKEVTGIDWVNKPAEEKPHRVVVTVPREGEKPKDIFFEIDPTTNKVYYEESELTIHPEPINYGEDSLNILYLERAIPGYMSYEKAPKGKGYNWGRYPVGEFLGMLEASKVPYRFEYMDTEKKKRLDRLNYTINLAREFKRTNPGKRKLLLDGQEFKEGHLNEMMEEWKILKGKQKKRNIATGIKGYVYAEPLEKVGELPSGGEAIKAVPPPAITLDQLNEAILKARGPALNILKGALRDFKKGDLEGAEMLLRKAQLQTGTDLTPSGVPSGPSQEPARTISGKDTGKTTPKAQKAFLIDSLDKLIKDAPEGEVIGAGNIPGTAKPVQTTAYETELKSKYGTVRIEVPDDGTFEIVNTKQALEAFRKAAQKYPVTAGATPDKAAPLPSTKGTGKRVELEDVYYYNEFRPRKQELIPSANGKEKTFYVDGFFTQGHYLVKTEMPKGIPISENKPEVKKVIESCLKNLQPAKIVGELYRGLAPDKSNALAHIIGKDANELIANAHYVDVILTKHPEAKVFIKKIENRREGGIVFKVGDEVVGVVMPVKGDLPNDFFTEEVSRIRYQAYKDLGTKGKGQFSARMKGRNFQHEVVERGIELRDEALTKVIWDFIAAPDKKQKWEVVPFEKLRKVWDSFGRYGYVKNVTALEEIGSLMVENVFKVSANTEMAGHSTANPKDLAESTGHEWTDELDEKFGDHILDESGHWRISDYGLGPLESLVYEYLAADTPERKLVVLDDMLNIVHQRSDIAAWFVQGGTKSLIKLAEWGQAQKDLTGRYSARQQLSLMEEDIPDVPADLQFYVDLATDMARKAVGDKIGAIEFVDHAITMKPYTPQGLAMARAMGIPEEAIQDAIQEKAEIQIFGRHDLSGRPGEKRSEVTFFEGATPYDVLHEIVGHVIGEHGGHGPAYFRDPEGFADQFARSVLSARGPPGESLRGQLGVGRVEDRTNVREARPDSNIKKDAIRYSIRLFSEEKEVDAPRISNAIRFNLPIEEKMISEWKAKAREAGVSTEGINRAVEKFRRYNQIRKIGDYVVMPKTDPKSVVVREGVLNTPAVEGIRRERLDKVYEGIYTGARSVEVGPLFEGGEGRTDILPSIRGLQPDVFLNVPINQPYLQKERPAGFDYPLVVTGNPHITNFKRPDKSWDELIKAVRVKPVLGGTAEVNRAVVSAINYAKEVGAHVLVTTFRAKNPWVVAKFTDFLPVNPKDPDFNTFWVKNPNPPAKDARRRSDWTPYVAKGDRVKEALRANGWDTNVNIYGTGGTWWWPTSRQLDPDIVAAIGDTPIEYCDLFHKGCPSCRNCQKLTYPASAGAPIVGVTDEPFCEHGCPQCFVRMGNSGTRGRRGISVVQNAKQRGFGEAQLADTYPQTVNILQKVIRPSGSSQVDYVSKFFHKSLLDKVDTLSSLFIDGKITEKEFKAVQGEIMDDISDQVASPADEILATRWQFSARQAKSLLDRMLNDKDFIYEIHVRAVEGKREDETLTPAFVLARAKEIIEDYHEGGHDLHDELVGDRGEEAQKAAREDFAATKRFIRKYENLVKKDTAQFSARKISPRTPWTDQTAKAVIHTGYNKMRNHEDYAAAKSGDTKAAFSLVRDLMSAEKIRALAKEYPNRDVVIYPVSAIEAGGVNRIPLAMADYISELTGWPVNTDVIQINHARHTGASAMERLLRQPLFDGEVTGELALIVDDVSTTGSTLASLKGYVESGGAQVIGIHALAQGTFGSNLRISLDTLSKLKENFGHDLPSVLESIYGQEVDPGSLTESEARTIVANRATLIDRSRERAVAAGSEAGPGRAALPAKEITRFSARQIPNFENWFQKSKVVDDKGEPLQVYHGTTETFEAFGGRWNYFADNPKFAEKFAFSETPIKERPREITAKVITKSGLVDAVGYETEVPGLIITDLNGEMAVTHAKSGYAVTHADSFEEASDIVAELAKINFGWDKPAEALQNLPDLTKRKIVNAVKKGKGAELAAMFGYKAGAKGFGPGSKIVPAYLSIQKPLDLRGLRARNVSAKMLIEELAKHGIEMTYRDLPFSGRDLYMMLNQESVIETLRAKAIEKGFDGIIYNDYYSPTIRATSYITFDPSQSKSPMNVGTWDRGTGNVLYSFAGKLARNWENAVGKFSNLMDKKERFEIDDSGAKWNWPWHMIESSSSLGSERHEYKMGEILHHAKLYDEYPDARDIKFLKQQFWLNFFNTQKGGFDEKTNTLYVSAASDENEALETALHEIQHWIEYKEGFATGGASENAPIFDALPNLRSIYERALEKIREEVEGKKKKGWLSVFNITSGSLERLEKEISEKLMLLDDLEDNKIQIMDNLKVIDGLQKKVAEDLKAIEDQMAALEKEYEALIAERKEKSPLQALFDSPEREELRKQYNALTEKIDKNRKEYWALSPKRWEGKQKKELEIAKRKDDVQKMLAPFDAIRFDAYKILAGEIESRDVSKRMKLTAEERLRTAPYEAGAEGIRADEAFVRFGAPPEEGQFSARKVDDLTPRRYLKITALDDISGKRRTFFLGNIQETDKFVSGIEVNKDAVPISGKGFDERRHMIDREAIESMEEYGQSKTYGDLQPRQPQFSARKVNAHPGFVMAKTPEEEKVLGRAKQWVKVATAGDDVSLYKNISYSKGLSSVSWIVRVGDRWIRQADKPSLQKMRDLQYDLPPDATKWDWDKAQYSARKVVKKEELPDFMKAVLGEEKKAEKKQYKFFKFDPKSTKNVGWLQLFPAEEFDKKSFYTSSKFLNLPTTEGVSYVIGRRKGALTVQAIHFDKRIFDEGAASSWWSANRHLLGTTTQLREPESVKPSKSPESIPDPVTEKGKVKAWIHNEAFEILKDIYGAMKPRNLPHSSFLEKLLSSPEFWHHPVLSRIVNIMTDVRPEIYHTIFNDLIDNGVVQALRELRRKDVGKMGRARGKTSKEYQMLEAILEFGDTMYKRDPKKTLPEQMADFQKWMKDRGASPEVMKAWRLYRDTLDKALDLMTQQMRDLIEEIEMKAKASGTTPQIEEVKTQLKFHLAQMQQWKGFYAPRERSYGSWWVWAHKGEEEIMDFRGSGPGAKRLARQWRRQGYTIDRVQEAPRAQEDLYQSITSVDLQKAIDIALKDLEKREASPAHQEMLLKFQEEVLQHVADFVKARGFRSIMIHRRTDKVIGGYKTDPLERLLLYTNKISRGIAKAHASKMALSEILGEYVDGERIGGIHPIREKRAYATAKDYIEEQLRNSDNIDRWVGLAKAVASFKYLGFNIRSIVGNITAILTTAPPAIHEYALDGKVSFARIMPSIATAMGDVAAHVTGKRHLSAEDEAFLQSMHKKAWDDQQYTREALAAIQGTGIRSIRGVMNLGMFGFGTSEKWIRGATMLSAFRLARKKLGLKPEEAARRAKLASDRAHGVYGKPTYPTWAQGRNPFARIAQFAYMFAKFGHTYMQALYDYGFRRNNIRALLFAIIAPLIVGGLKAWPFREQLMAILGASLRIMGFERDPEKFFWDEVRRELGPEMEQLGRFGLMGYSGFDISSTLSVGVGVPKDWKDATGAVGGVIDDLSEAYRYGVGQGRWARAAEAGLPKFASNLLESWRESQEGITTKHGYRVWTPEGKPLYPTPAESIIRAAGARSGREAVLADRTYEAKREISHFNERRNAIYEKYRAYLAGGGRDAKMFKEIVEEKRKFNQGLIDNKINRHVVAPIEMEAMRRQSKEMTRPSKKERAIMRD